MRDSDRAELGDEDVDVHSDMYEQSEPRLPAIRWGRSTSAPSPTRAASSVRTASDVDGSGADSSCCRNDSMSR